MDGLAWLKQQQDRKGTHIFGQAHSDRQGSGAKPGYARTEVLCVPEERK